MTLEAYGSKDDLVDIVDKLEETGANYVLVVGVPGENISKRYWNVNPEYLETAKDAVATLEL